MQYFRGFLDAQAAEEAQLDDEALASVDRGQTAQRAIECEQVQVARWRGDDRFLEGNSLQGAAAFAVSARSGMIDEHAAHEACGNGDEVRAILPGQAPGVDQPDERLVDERGGLQRMAAALAAHVRAGEAPQLTVDQRQQALERVLVAAAPRAKQLGRVLSRCPRSHRESATNSLSRAPHGEEYPTRPRAAGPFYTGFPTPAFNDLVV